jgi:hypothetical protein
MLGCAPLIGGVINYILHPNFDGKDENFSPPFPNKKMLNDNYRSLLNLPCRTIVIFTGMR